MALRLRPLRWIGALVALELAWIVGANVFLNTGLARTVIVRHPGRWTVTWDRAWSWYPAQLRAEGLTYRFHGRKSEFTVAADRVETSIDLRALLDRSLIFEDVRADTVDLAIFRHEERTDVAPPPDRPPGWLVVLDDIEIGRVERLVVDDVAVGTGAARASGTLSKRVRGDLELSDLVVVWEDAVMSVRGEDLAAALDLSFRGSMGPFSPREHRGRASLAFLSGTLRAHGLLGSLAPLHLLLADAKWIDHLEGRGNVFAVVELEDGFLMPGSRVEIDSAELDLDFLGFRAVGRGGVDLVNGSPEEGGRLLVDFERFDVALPDGSRPFALGEGLHLEATARRLSIARAPEDLAVDLRLPDAEITDLSILSRYLPPSLGVKITGGDATFGFALSVAGAERDVDGRLRIVARNLTGTYRDFPLGMRLDLDVPLHGSRPADFVLSLDDAELAIRDATFEDPEQGRVTGWWLEADLADGRAELRDPFRASTALTLRMRDTRPVVALFAETKKWVRFFDGLLTIEDVRGAANLEMGNGRLDLGDIALTGRRLEALGDLRLKEGKDEGLLWVKFRGLSAALERDATGSRVHLRNSRAWFEDRRAELGGS